jgi:2-polyprenyl-3-methyl-5-hydroxy-6-metoxy-1,4-benzoquinol methylase
MIDQRPQDDSRAGPACPVCATSNAGGYAVATDRLFGVAPGRYCLHHCRLCGCIFQHPLPDRMALASFYPRRYWWAADGPSGFAATLSRMERRYREFVGRDHVRFLQHCARGGGRGRSLLDIGCGNGTFLHLARQRGFIPHGMDLSEHAVAAARAQYNLTVHCGDIGSDLWQARAFDFITMFHVLEHLPEPRQALEYAHGLLKPDGSLILQVPNAASLQARAFGARWYGLDVPRHLINFTPRSLGMLLDQAGFSWQIVQRFSLRDNPASIASSLALRLDPIGRRGRGKATNPVAAGAFELMYFGLFLLALPPAWIESILGHGGTIWIRAKRASRQAALITKLRDH